MSEYLASGRTIQLHPHPAQSLPSSEWKIRRNPTGEPGSLQPEKTKGPQEKWEQLAGPREMETLTLGVLDAEGPWVTENFSSTLSGSPAKHGNWRPSHTPGLHPRARPLQALPPATFTSHSKQASL